MRTRFLAIDYFDRASKQTLGTGSFTISRLPVPRLDSKILGFELNFHEFDLVFRVSYELEPLKFENALLYFLSECLPTFYGGLPVFLAGRGDREGSCRGGVLLGTRTPDNAISNYDKVDGLSSSSWTEIRLLEATEEEKENTNSEKCDFGVSEVEEACSVIDGNGIKLFSSSGNLDIETVENSDKQSERTAGIEFETHEVLDKVQSWGEEDQGIRFDFLAIGIPLEHCNTEFGDVIPYPYEALKSVYLVEDITTPRPGQEDPDSTQDRALVQRCSFLSFEVPETGVELYSCQTAEEFQFLLSYTQPLLNTKNSLLGDDLMQILEPKEFDILECLTREDSPDAGAESVSLVSLLGVDFDCKGKNTSHGDDSMSKIALLDEALVLDMDPFLSFEDFPNGMEPLDQIEDDVDSLGNFYDNYIDSELALLDDKIMSFPLPLLHETRETLTHSFALDAIIGGLKPHLASACDEIYLDWQLLQGDTCNDVISSVYTDMVERMDNNESVPGSHWPEGETLANWLFCDNVISVINVSTSKDIANELPDANNILNEPLSDINLDIKPSQNEFDKSQKGLALNPMKTSLKSTSISQFNDLNFFLNGRKGTAKKKREDLDKLSDGIRTACPASSMDQIVICDSPDDKNNPWKMKMHSVKLSNDMLSLIERIKVCYFSIIEGDAELGKQSYPLRGGFDWFGIPKQKLLNLIRDASARGSESMPAYFALYAIKQMVHYLCFFGVHSALLYISNLSQNFQYLRVKLEPIQSLMEDAHGEVAKGLIEPHPSVSAIEEILGSQNCQSADKILVVAERVFLLPLKRKLAAMSMRFEELGNSQTYMNQQSPLNNELCLFGLKPLHHSTCVLASFEDIVSSFPFHNFAIILEYGGANDSSKISTLSPPGARLPLIIFLNLELEKNSMPAVLCQGFGVCQHSEVQKEIFSTAEPEVPVDFPGKQLQGQLGYVPVLRNNAKASFDTDTVETLHPSKSTSDLPLSGTSANITTAPTEFTDSIIVVNTQNSDKDMLISRRSSYQKILAMEKDGIQVVERELNLPVDLIFTAGICLVLYDAKSVAPAGNVVSSGLAEKMEHIAANILMSLSYAFSGCVVVFEGENGFLSAVMESSDALYAAAASLDMHLQLFFSYSSEITDEIILSCIHDARKLNRGLYLPMPESATLGESFLTSFPSINPVSAHAIMSSHRKLGDFLEWSHERRIHAGRSYGIPLESVILLSTLCKYGDLGESKSGTTDCSSSVSSAIDSDFSTSKMELVRKKQKHIEDEVWHFEALSNGKDQRPTRMPPRNSKILEADNQKLSAKGDFFDQKQHFDSWGSQKLDWNEVNITKRLHEDLGGEVINNNSSLLEDDFYFRANPRPIRRRLTFGSSNHASFPTSEQIDCDPDEWISIKDSDKLFEDKTGASSLFREGDLPAEWQGKLAEEGQPSTTNDIGLSFARTVEPSFGDRATRSDQQQQASPWTIEFLNKVKEKTKRYHKPSYNLSCNTCTVCTGDPSKGNTSKRKSPSVFDSYKYQGGSRNKKMTPQVWRRQAREPSVPASREKTDLAITPQWIPLDKKAGQVLSFARHGNQKQSKLVWRAGNIQRV